VEEPLEGDASEHAEKLSAERGRWAGEMSCFELRMLAVKVCQISPPTAEKEG